MVREREGTIVVVSYWSTVNRRAPNATCCLRPLSFTTCFSFWLNVWKALSHPSNLRTSAQTSPILWNETFMASWSALTSSSWGQSRPPLVGLFLYQLPFVYIFLPKRLESLRVGTTPVSFLYSQCLAQRQGQSRCSMTNTYICWI